VPVTSPLEIAEIDKAAATKEGFEGVSEHINTALGFLATKPEPDYSTHIRAMRAASGIRFLMKLL